MNRQRKKNKVGEKETVTIDELSYHKEKVNVCMCKKEIRDDDLI